MAAVRAELAYFTRPPPGAPVPVMGSKETRHSLTAKHDVAIADARALPMELQANGVELFRHRTALVDWEDKAEVREVYYAEIAALVQRATGADFVLPYNHITRHSAADNFTQAFARFAHVDWVHSAGGASDAAVERLRAQLVRKLGLAEEEAGKLELCTVNTWQPWRQTVRANPLALLDAASVDLERDTMKYSFAGSGLREQGFSKTAVGADGTPLIGLTHSPQHRCKPPRYRCRLGCILLTTAAISLLTGVWYSEMREDECLVFKQMDTRRDNSARLVFHSSFDNPCTEEGAEGRRSIETRVICGFAPPRASEAPKL